MNLLHHVRGYCVASPAHLVALVLGNGIIAACYLVIPWRLGRIVRAVGSGAPGVAEIRGTAVFVRACGWTHLATIAVIFWPSLDWPAVVVLAVTCVVSAAFAFRLRRSESAAVRALRSLRDLAEHLHA